MDNLTHTLIGVAVGEAGLARRVGRGTTALLAIASNLPDVDVATRLFFDWEAPMFRRTVTHSVVGLPILAAILATVAGRFMPRVAWRTRFALTLLGAVLHVGFDLVNSYGVVALWPFSQTRFELAWVFIIDPFIWLILGLPLLFRWVRPAAARPALPFAAALIVLALYVAGCGVGRTAVGSAWRASLQQSGLRPEFTYVFPEPLGPHRWRGVARIDGLYRLWLLGVDGRRDEWREQFPTTPDDPAVRAVRATRRGQLLDWFFKAPVWRHDRAAGVVEARDLRFQSIVFGGRAAPFVYRFPSEPAGGEPR